MKQMAIENKRVVLEPLEMSHFDELLPLAYKYPDLLQFSPVPFGNSRNLKQYITKAIHEHDQRRRWVYAVYDKCANKFAGSTSFILISEFSKVMEIGSTWIGREFQGTALNANMKYVMMKHLFEELQFERLEFKTDERNKASIKALKKIGAKYEGLLRKHMLMLDGHRRSSVIYSIVKSEWPIISDSIKLNP